MFCLKEEADMRTILLLIIDENGQGMAEYAIIMAFVVVIVIVAIGAFGASVRDNLNNSGNKIGTV